MFEHTPSDRVQLAGLGELVHPACCMLCGSGNCTEGYVNLGVWYEYEGQMYLCWTCMVQAAEVIGCSTPAESQYLSEMNVTLAAANEQLTESNMALHDRLAFYDRIISGADSNIDSLTVSPVEHPSTPTDKSTEVASGGEPTTSEPVESSGRSKLEQFESPNPPPRKSILKL